MAPLVLVAQQVEEVKAVVQIGDKVFDDIFCFK